MVEISKHLFDEACAERSCYDLLHPWHPNCYVAALMTYRNSIVGSAKFYSLIYLAQVLMRGKKMLEKQECKKMAQYYLRSTILGALVCSNIVVLGCLFRWLNGGKFNYYCLIFLPSLINGICIYLEPPSRRGLVINLFSSLTLEYWLRTLESYGYISLTKSKQTLMFMIGSAFLFYLMRLEGDKKERTPLFWLFTPEKVKRKSDDKNICPHNGSCFNYILKGTASYFGLGLALSLAKVLLPKITTPLKAFSSLRIKHLRMALFFGSYIGIYRAVICYLCRNNGYDSAMYALPAGYVAGLSFIFNPSLGFATASLTGAFKLYSTILYEKKILPDNIPLPEITYSICQATLFHAKIMHSAECPRYISKLGTSVSNGLIVYFDASAERHFTRVPRLGTSEHDMYQTTFFNTFVKKVKGKKITVINSDNLFNSLSVKKIQREILTFIMRIIMFVACRKILH